MSKNTGGDDGETAGKRAPIDPLRTRCRRRRRASLHAHEKKRADNSEVGQQPRGPALEDTMDGESAVPLARCPPWLAQTGARQLAVTGTGSGRMICARPQ
jgi:hypothetical protein